MLLNISAPVPMTLLLKVLLNVQCTAKSAANFCSVYIHHLSQRLSACLVSVQTLLSCCQFIVFISFDTRETSVTACQIMLRGLCDRLLS
jgi:hypothetical protein